MPIRILAEKVVDQIAAGEVLERPAHLIKELVENSIDAGATEIEIEYDNGGRNVRISDNGCGMTKEDLPLALLRHATSKIQASEDLFRLSSFGFRGEALASIAAVSRLTITSRTKKDQEAHVLRSEFGETESLSTASAPAGTSIVTDGLFENVPARLKFLKSDAAESAQIKSVLKALALAHPNVQFRVRSKGQLQSFWPAKADWKSRAEEVLDFKPFYEAQGEENGIQVRALLGSPNHTLQQNRGLWIFVQDRWVQDRSLAVAVIEAYRHLLMHGEYPQVVLSLHVPKEFVDVNVHPTKSQVKFIDAQKVFRAVHHVLRATLEQAPWVPSRPAVALTPSPSEEETTVRFDDAAFSAIQYQKKEFQIQIAKEPTGPYESHAPVRADGQVFWSQMEVIGQAQLTYIVAQTQGDFYLVDQHAAHERIVFERLMKQWKAARFDSQSLLLPLAIDLPIHEMEAIETTFSQMHALGLTVEKMGPETLAISAIPSFVTESGVVHAIKNLANEMAANGGSFAWERKVGDLFASMACHSVVRAGQNLSIEQMKSLLAQMDEFPLSTFCPHGRPVSVNWSFAELERKFGRIL
jgi:DNA mismatch repair protein MutL